MTFASIAADRKVAQMEKLGAKTGMILTTAAIMKNAGGMNMVKGIAVPPKKVTMVRSTVNAETMN